jgi:serine/threonine-protein kinase RsbW
MAATSRILEMDFPAERRIVHDVRRRLEEFLQPYEVGADELEALKVALSEAASNAVCHGSPRGETDRVRVEFRTDGRSLDMSISDQGGGFRPAQVALPEFEEWKPSGRGIFLIYALVDEVHFEAHDEGTRVRLTKHLRPEPAPASELPHRELMPERLQASGTSSSTTSTTTPGRSHPGADRSLRPLLRTSSAGSPARSRRPPSSR